MSSSLFVSLEPIVTWIKVEKPSFDLVGVVLGSFRLAGILLVLALVLGLLLGAALLRSRRRPGPTPIEAVSLHLDTRA
jgi:ABC-type spermidine/putrescine transport system permease subunit II